MTETLARKLIVVAIMMRNRSQQNLTRPHLLKHPLPTRQVSGRNEKGQVSVLQLVLLMVVLAVTWMGLSGFFKPLLLSLGAISIGITLMFAVRTGFFKHATGTTAMASRLPGYWLWLLLEIVKSAIQVARIVLSPRLPMNHRLVKLTLDDEDALPGVILGNSITLSPGTITVDIDGRVVLVHCISEEGAQDMESGELLRRIRRLKGGQ